MGFNLKLKRAEEHEFCERVGEFGGYGETRKRVGHGHGLLIEESEGISKLLKVLRACARVLG